MSPKTRFQVMLEPGQLTNLRGIESSTGASIGEQIRRGVDLWIAANAAVARVPEPRPAPRKRKRATR